MYFFCVFSTRWITGTINLIEMGSMCSLIRFHVKKFQYHTSFVAQLVKNLPAVQETRVQSLGRKDPLEEEMARNSSILVWEISWTEEPGGLQSMVLQRVRYD